MRHSNARHSYVLIMTLCGIFFGAIFHSKEARAFAGDRNYSYRQNGAKDTLVVTSLGDSIAAGYCGIGCLGMDSYVQYFAYKNDQSIAKTLNVSIDGRGRAVSGYTSKEILNWIDHYESNPDSGAIDQTVDIALDVQQADVITVEACGNDYLPARRSFEATCDEAKVLNAVNECRKNLNLIYAKLANYAKKGAVIRAMNIYYPGMNKDKQGQCNGKSYYDVFLKYLVQGNYYTCEIARQYGFKCADSFSVMNTSDEDRAKITWIPGESLESYEERLTVTHKSLLSDPTQKRTPAGVINLLQDDNTHPTKEGHARLGMLHMELGMDPSK